MNSSQQFASLYVGDLNGDVTEAMLYEIFNAVGPVASIRVCRDSLTRRSLGYAYVNYHAVADAERALDTLNYSQIKGRSCRIMWSHRDPAMRKVGSGNIFVKNLDKNIDNKALYDTFSLFGNILSCKVACDMSGNSKGYGFVHYETEEAAKDAINRVNGMQIGEKTVFVGPFLKGNERTTEPMAFTNIFVKNIPDEWDEAKLTETFTSFGQITSSMVNKDKQGRMFAFMNFATMEAARAAVDAMHNKDVTADGSAPPITEEEENIPGRLYCQRAMSKAERQSHFSKTAKKEEGVNLYVKNLDESLNDEGLKALFTTYGTISSAVVARDDNGNSKGFGFICFSNAEEATKAVQEMHLKMSSGKPLYVALAEKKEERLARLQQRYRASPDQFGQMGNPMFGNGGVGGMGGMPQGPYGNQMMGGPRPGMRPMGPRPGGMRPMMGGMGGGMMGQMQRPMMGQMMGGKGGGMQMRPGGMRPPAGPMGGAPMRPMNQPPMQQRPPQAQMPFNPNAPLTAGALAAAPPGMQKQMLGEKLFPLISRMQPEMAGKITGMMLEMDNSELLILLESPDQMKAKVNEALRVLEGSR